MSVGRLSKQILSSAGLSAAARLISFTGIIVYTNSVPQTTLGQYFLFVAVISTVGYLGTLGSATKVLREISRDQESSTELTTAIVITTVVAVVFLIIAITLGPTVNGYVGRDVTTFLLVGIPAELYFQITGSTLRGEKKVIRAQALDTGQIGIRYTGGVAAVAAGYDPFLSVAGSFLLGKIVHSVAAFVMIDTGLSRVEDVAGFLSDSLPMLVVRANSFGQQWLDTLVLGFFVPEGFIAVYEVAWQLSSAALLVVNSIMAAGFPEISDMFYKQERERARVLSEKMYFYGMLPVIGFLGGAMVVGEEVLALLYGFEYTDAWLPLVILSLGRLFYVFETVSNKILYALNEQTASAKLAVVGSTSNVVLNVALIPPLLLPGAAVATASSYLLQAILLVWLAIDQSGLSLQLSQFVKPTLVTLIMMGVVYSYQGLLNDSIGTLVSSILIGVVVFVVGLWSVSSEFRNDLDRVFTALAS